MVEMLGIYIGDDRDGREQQQEGGVALVGFGLRYRADGEDLDRWLALGSTILVFAELHAVFTPSLASTEVSQGDFLRAVASRERIVALTKVLYPSDHSEAGRQLRLMQEYFLVACSVRDIVKRFHRRHGEEWDLFPEKVAIQLNDTHPALAVVELLRVLLDEAGLHDVLVTAGGIIPDDDVPALKGSGVAAVFGPGTTIHEVAEYLRANAHRRD